MHVVVPGERGAHQVLRPVLHPLDRAAGDHRADDRTDITRVHRGLVAEAAADVRGDDPDLVLGQAKEQRVQRPVRVRGLRGGPHGQLPADLVHVGDRPARLQRGRVDPRVEHVLADRHLGVAEDLVGAFGVAGLPVEDVVAGPVLQVVADERGVGVQCLAGVGHRGQQLVLHVDQLERVPGRVVVVGHHERHLLALEPDLVGGQHGLPVTGQGGHPGQAASGQGLAGDDGLDLGVGLGRDGVDGDDPGVRVRAAQHRAVEHAGQVHIVHVRALAADEPLVFLAQHPPEARGHCDPPGCSAECWAAQRTERTMFS